MPFGTWWRGDPLPALPPLSAFSAHITTDTALIARVTHLTRQAINRRIREGNQPYIAFVEQTPVAYGWIATREGGITELQFSFSVSKRNAYLWDFLTLPQWRGQGIYPRLLQTIVCQEQLIDRFWIGYVPGNTASARGIHKAGFRVVSDLVISGNRIAGLALLDDSERARISAKFFQLPIVPES
ncbi:MAG TPA: GNAT family N-acetyltransferase [Ktedonobacteraceae bacterium]|jgi:GNAT superfamily N-acetyltransferase